MTSPQCGHSLPLRIRGLPNAAVQPADVNEQTPATQSQWARSLTAPKETQSLTFDRRGPEKVAVQRADVNEQTAADRIPAGFAV